MLPRLQRICTTYDDITPQTHPSKFECYEIKTKRKYKFNYMWHGITLAITPPKMLNFTRNFA